MQCSTSESRFIYHSEHALDALKTPDGKKAFVCIGGGFR